MNKTIIRPLILLLSLAPINILQAQIEKGELFKGRLVTSEIAPTEKHQYSINLDKDQFVFFRLLQKGVDIKVSTFDSEGVKIKDFDSPTGRNSLELFELTTSKKGVYAIEVSPFNEKEPSGNYELIIKLIKPKATTANEQVDEIFTPWDSNDKPGAAIAIVKNNTIIYKKGYGMANLEYDIPISSNSIFHIASVSKQFTVFSILLLEKQGKLSLDDDIRKYIPEVPDFGKIITLRHLATHTSGLRDQWNLLSIAGWRMDDVITKEHVLKLISKQKELNFDPGAEYAYCNTGFTLLAEVVSRVSEMSFAEFTNANIFKPLKMNNTLFYDDHEKIVENRAYSYYADKTEIKKSVLNYAIVGATSLFTTVEDLSIWSMNFSNTKLGDKDILNKMNTPAILNNGKTFGGALGQFVGKYNGLNEIQHGGADAGYRSYLTRFPDENLSVIVLSNSAEFDSGRIAHKVVDVFLKDKFKNESKNNKDKSNETVSTNKLEELTLNQISGNYEIEAGIVLEIEVKNNTLHALQTWNKNSYTLVNTIGNTYEIPDDSSIQFVFSELKDNHTKTLTVFQNGTETISKRVKKINLSKIKLTDFTGDFYSEELSTTYSFVIVDNKLVAKHSRLSDFNLNPTKKDMFNGEVWFFGQVEFVRDSNRVITACKVSNGRVRNLRFEKIN